MRLPITALQQADTHRLIAVKHSGVSVLSDLLDPEDGDELFELEGATSSRLLAQEDREPGINRDELVSKIPFDYIINASFCYANPNGGRFNNSERGAWYAGFELDTALQEIVWHHTQILQETNIWYDEAQKVDWIADFSGDFHDLRGGNEDWNNYLDPDPAIAYPQSQSLAAQLLEDPIVSAGIVYPSVRHAGGINIACFRPALVDNLRKGQVISLTWSGSALPKISVL
jgi:RES domain-containing protein